MVRIQSPLGRHSCSLRRLAGVCESIRKSGVGQTLAATFFRIGSFPVHSRRRRELAFGAERILGKLSRSRRTSASFLHITSSGLCHSGMAGKESPQRVVVGSVCFPGGLRTRWRGITYAFAFRNKCERSHADRPKPHSHCSTGSICRLGSMARGACSSDQHKAILMDMAVVLCGNWHHPYAVPRSVSWTGPHTAHLSLLTLLPSFPES